MKQITLLKLIELALLFHGIGLIGGIYFTLFQPSWFSRALNAGKAANYIGTAIWLIAGVLIVATAWALYKDLSWWKTASYLVLVFNTLAGVLWFNGVPVGATFGVVVTDAALVYLLIK